MKKIEYLVRTVKYAKVKVKGYKLDFNLDGYTFAVNRPLGMEKRWVLTNLETGVAISLENFATRKEAYNYLNNLDSYARERYVRGINEFIDKIGVLNKGV